MTGLYDLDGPAVPSAAQGAPDSIVVFLHGYGADGDDLIALAPHLARALPRTLFISPHAPFACEMGFGRQWFSFEDRWPQAILAGADTAARLIGEFLDALLARTGLADSRLALVGFSQGTMMALHAAPRRVQACAAIVGFSGRLLDDGTFAAAVRSRPPVLLVHGEADGVVPVAALDEAVVGLKAAGIAVEAQRRPGLEHSIDQEGMAGAALFLRTHLGA
ncbi:MAG: alpha/beta hydrolase [Alphaproteobacteria bacterium]